jgi:hypothetical protein
MMHFRFQGENGNVERKDREESRIKLDKSEESTIEESEQYINKQKQKRACKSMQELEGVKKESSRKPNCLKRR